jgi:hypothetical protein
VHAKLTRGAVPNRFCETLQAAKGGDVNSMELLSQMLNEGYGCQRDTTLVRKRCAASCGSARRAHARPSALPQARYWRSVAQSRGARRLDGVYDRLP